MKLKQDWLEQLAQITLPSCAFIAGQFINTTQTYKVSNPATAEFLVDMSACDANDVDQAVQHARRTFNNGVWSRLAPRERKQILKKLAELIRENAEELALLETLNVGKPIQDSLHVDIPGAASCFEWYAESIDKIYDEIAPTSVDQLALVSREPVGVVAAVVPCNFPLDLASWKLAPALATGNCVVLKPAEQSPFTALKLAELAKQAGIPDGVLQVLTGLGHITGQALGRHPDVDCLVFTGSTETAKKFLAYSAESNMKPVWPETGGKSANIIFADADLDPATYVAPTILIGVNPDFKIFHDEVFGPVVSITIFETQEEAIELANHSIYGLAASIWTKDIQKAILLSKQLLVGTVSINTVDALDVSTPFGGYKQSGYGRDLSLHAIDKFTQLKTTWIQL